jgi:hypothetical protein
MTPEDHANNLEAMAQGYRDEIVDAEEGVASYPKPCRAKERAEGALRMMRLELAACEAGAAALRQQGQTCRWTEEEYGEYWESACGETWSFTDGGPAENNARFCHGCGKPLEAVAYEIPLEEAD